VGSRAAGRVRPGNHRDRSGRIPDAVHRTVTAYLRDVLGRVSTHPASRIDDLLPDRRVRPERAVAGAR